jgi:hypothetical protein
MGFMGTPPIVGARECEQNPFRSPGGSRHERRRERVIENDSKSLEPVTLAFVNGPNGTARAMARRLVDGGPGNI